MKKAKEHYELYVQDKVQFGEIEAVTKLMQRMSEELLELKEIRHISTDKSFMSCLEEINQKWNALCKYDPMFIRDGFKAFWQEHLA
jgi:hypothetical protein